MRVFQYFKRMDYSRQHESYQQYICRSYIYILGLLSLVLAYLTLDPRNDYFETTNVSSIVRYLSATLQYSVFRLFSHFVQVPLRLPLSKPYWLH